MANRSRFRVVRVHRRGTFWGRSPADTSFTVLAAGTSVLDSTFQAGAPGLTIMRTRGHIAVMTDQAAAAQEDQIGAVGFAVASDQAVAVGVGSLPTPYTDQDSELWFAFQYFVNRTRIDSASVHSPSGLQIFPFDSKAMRKMATGETLIVVVENGAATHGLVYMLNYSVLLKVE